jgi:uncharacterized protein YjbI with pentapeptide repeats
MDIVAKNLFYHIDERDRIQEKELGGAQMKQISSDDFLEMLESREGSERIDLSRLLVSDVDLSGKNLSNIDFSESYTWTTALVDDDFLYEKGKMVYPANGFDEYPWMSDAAGIHFFVDRDLAIAFGAGDYS